MVRKLIFLQRNASIFVISIYEVFVWMRLLIPPSSSNYKDGRNESCKISWKYQSRTRGRYPTTPPVYL